jgi:hypothetical protein
MCTISRIEYWVENWPAMWRAIRKRDGKYATVICHPPATHTTRCFRLLEGKKEEEERGNQERSHSVKRRKMEEK